jgi:glycosyltransferase involved in cell wall biosynthesis
MMKTNSPVEIFVLSYNRADSLRDCLQSILQQTLSDFTVTVLDNHSEEDIASVVSSFQDNRLKLIVNPTNIGGYSNWMQACNMASSDYMMTFHDDDCMSPRMLERQVQLFKKYSNLSHVSAGVNLVNRKSEMLVFDDVDTLDYKIFETPKQMVDSYLFGKEVFGYGSVLYKTHIVKQIQPDNERFLNMADRPYMVSLTTFGPCIQMRVPTYNVRVHSGQESGMHNWSYLADIEVCRYYLKMSGKPKSFHVRNAIMGVLAANYAARHPRTPLREWLWALRGKDIFYWQVLVFKLPLYLLRDCIKRFIVKIVPNLYVQSVAKRVRRKKAVR